MINAGPGTNETRKATTAKFVQVLGETGIAYPKSLAERCQNPLRPDPAAQPLANYSLLGGAWSCGAIANFRPKHGRAVTSTTDNFTVARSSFERFLSFQKKTSNAAAGRL